MRKKTGQTAFGKYRNAGIDAMELSVGNKSACDVFDVKNAKTLAEEFGVERRNYHLPFEILDISQTDIADSTVEYYKASDTMSCPREFTCEDFARNEEEILDRKETTVIK